MTKDEVEDGCHSRWNPQGRVAIDAWLTPELTAVQKARLHTLGNIVIPQCARLSLHVFAHLLQAQADA